MSLSTRSGRRAAVDSPSQHARIVPRLHASTACTQQLSERLNGDSIGHKQPGAPALHLGAVMSKSPAEKREVDFDDGTAEEVSYDAAGELS